MFCEKCGKKIDDNSRFCEHCGSPCVPLPAASPVQNGKSNKTKLAVIISASAAALVATVVIILVIVLNAKGPGQAIVGKWYSSDDYVLDFRESGYMIYRDDRLDTHETHYYVSGDLLHIDNFRYKDYQYSVLAKNDNVNGNYWFIEGDTLYLGHTPFFKK